ncbi:MAG: hypothetical protein IPL61_14090 [Myxococcales bacterium]|nr:hypothetical protein [Myxococcales bacterium]
MLRGHVMLCAWLATAAGVRGAVAEPRAVTRAAALAAVDDAPAQAIARARPGRGGRLGAAGG